MYRTVLTPIPEESEPFTSDLSSDLGPKTSLDATDTFEFPVAISASESIPDRPFSVGSIDDGSFRFGIPAPFNPVVVTGPRTVPKVANSGSSEAAVTDKIAESSSTAMKTSNYDSLDQYRLTFSRPFQSKQPQTNCSVFTAIQPAVPQPLEIPDEISAIEHGVGVNERSRLPLTEGCSSDIKPRTTPKVEKMGRKFHRRCSEKKFESTRSKDWMHQALSLSIDQTSSRNLNHSHKSWSQDDGIAFSFRPAYKDSIEKSQARGVIGNAQSQTTNDNEEIQQVVVASPRIVEMKELSSVEEEHSASRYGTRVASRSGTESRISKSTRRSTPKLLSSNQQTPTVGRALSILQWAWNQERSALETCNMAEIKALKQELAKSNEERSVLEESFRNSRIDIEELRARLEDERQKRSENRKRLEESSRILSGLVSDLNNERQLTSNVKSYCESIKEELADFHKQQKDAAFAVDTSLKDIKSLKDKYQSIFENSIISVERLTAEKATLQQDLIDRSRLLREEKQARAQDQEKLMERVNVADTFKRLLDIRDERLFEKFENLKQFWRNQPSESTFAKLSDILALLREIYSRPAATLIDMNQIKHIWRELENRIEKSIADMRKGFQIQIDVEDTLAKTQDIQKIETQLQAFQSDLLSYATTQSQLRDLHEAKYTLEKQVKFKDEKLRKRDAELKQVVSENNLIKEQLQELENSMKTLSFENDSLKLQQSILEQSVRTNAAEQKQKFEDLQSARETADKAAKCHSNQVDTLQLDNSQLRKKLDDAIAERNCLERELSEAKKSLSQAYNRPQESSLLGSKNESQALQQCQCKGDAEILNTIVDESKNSIGMESRQAEYVLNPESQDLVHHPSSELSSCPSVSTPSEIADGEFESTSWAYKRNTEPQSQLIESQDNLLLIPGTQYSTLHALEHDTGTEKETELPTSESIAKSPQKFGRRSSLNSYKRNQELTSFMRGVISNTKQSTRQPFEPGSKNSLSFLNRTEPNSSLTEVGHSIISQSSKYSKSVDDEGSLFRPRSLLLSYQVQTDKTLTISPPSLSSTDKNSSQPSCGGTPSIPGREIQSCELEELLNTPNSVKSSMPPPLTPNDTLANHARKAGVKRAATTQAIGERHSKRIALRSSSMNPLNVRSGMSFNGDVAAFEFNAVPPESPTLESMPAVTKKTRGQKKRTIVMNRFRKELGGI